MDNDPKRGFSGLTSLASGEDGEQGGYRSNSRALDRDSFAQDSSMPTSDSTESGIQHFKTESISKGSDTAAVVVLSLLSLMTVLVIWQSGWTHESLDYITLAGFLLALSAVNLKTMRLPNKLNLYGAISAVVLCMVLTPEQWLHSLLGGLVGGGIWMSAGLLGRLVFKKEMFGMGVIKMGAMIGFFIGAARSIGALLFTIILASIILPFSRRQRKGLSPFGPFLAAGTLLVLLIGELAWRWCISLVNAKP